MRCVRKSRLPRMREDERFFVPVLLRQAFPAKLKAANQGLDGSRTAFLYVPPHCRDFHLREPWFNFTSENTMANAA